MLGKVLKYELRALSRFLLPFFGFCIAGAAILRTMMWLAPIIWKPAAEIVIGISSGISVLLIMALLVMTVIIILARFYQSMIASEGYLNFTLPVTTHAHLLGRTIAGLIFGTAGVFIAYLSGRITSWWPNQPFFLFPPGHMTFMEVEYKIPVSLYTSFLALILLGVIIAILSSLLKVYTAMALGSQLNKSRILGSILFYLAINMAETFILMPLMMFSMVKIFGNNNFSFQEFGFYPSLTPVETLQVMSKYMWIIMGVVFGLYAVACLVYYLVTHFIFSKKLNLE